MAFVYPKLEVNYNDYDMDIVDENTCNMRDLFSFNAFCKEVAQGQFLRILCANIRSIRSNFIDFQAYIASLETEFHVILLVETWLEKQINNGFELPSYISYDVFRSSHGGGLKLYISSSFRSAKINELCQVNESFESLFAKITIGHSNKINLGCIYRIPSSPINVFNDEFFNNYLSQFGQQNTIIMGDLNINLFNPHNINAIDDYLHNFLALNFKPLMLYPTRIQRDDDNDIISCSLIDHIFTNIDQKFHSNVIQYDLTNHFRIASFVSIN